MGNRFASGKYAIAQCDRCDQRFKLTQLRREVIKTKNYELLVCPECWDPDQPQLQLGMYPVDDPQGLRNPRPDRSYLLSGTSGLQTDINGGTGPTGSGTVEGGSRIFQWGWNPVGGSRANDDGLTPNNLILTLSVGSVSVVVNGPYPFATVNGSAVYVGILQAVAGLPTPTALFSTTRVNGRRLADITNNGTVSIDDALIYNQWVGGSLTNATYIDYIENVMNPYMLSNPTTYAAYLIFS